MLFLRIHFTASVFPNFDYTNAKGRHGILNQ
jgi:hypothetical protein